MHAADAGERDLLGEDHVGEQVRGRAAVFLREADAEQARGGGLAVELARKFLRLVPGGGVRRDLARNEAAHGVAQRLVLVGEGRMRLHAGSSSTSSCPGATCAPGATCTALTRAACGTLSACSIFIASSTTSALAGLHRLAGLGVDGDHAAVHRRDEAAVGCGRRRGARAARGWCRSRRVALAARGRDGRCRRSISEGDGLLRAIDRDAGVGASIDKTRRRTRASPMLAWNASRECASATSLSPKRTRIARSDCCSRNSIRRSRRSRRAAPPRWRA